jgi:hypothetical protein
VYAGITLEIAALDTPNNVVVSDKHTPAKHMSATYPLSKSDKSPIFQFFYKNCHSTEPLMH